MAEIGGNRREDWPLAVIVGAGGMGMALARRLGQTHRLLLADRDGEHLERQIAMLSVEGFDAASIRCDVTRDEDIASVAAQAKRTGPVRTLVYVVGLSVSAVNFQKIIAVNLVAAHTVAETFHKVLAPGGCAIFISSSAGHMDPVSETLWSLLDEPRQADFPQILEATLGDSANAGEAYKLSKFALNRMCQRNAVTWGRRSLRIVSVSPGLIATPMGAESYKHSPLKYRLFDAIPLAREGTMLEIANVVEFLASDKASYISGTDILVDGGLVAALKFPSAP